MQKKSITKKYIFTLLILVSFFGFHNHTQAAGSCVDEIKAVFDNTITISRKEEFPVIQTIVKSENTCFSNNGQTKVVPDNYKDFTFEYNPVGFDSFDDVLIPDNVVSLNYGGTGVVPVQLPKTISRNTVFEGKFKEEYQLPDVLGPKKIFWFDTAEFDNISIKNGSITGTSAEFDGSVTYKNSAAQDAGKIVPARNIAARVYKSDGTVFGEYVLSNSASLKYGQPLSLYAKVTGLSPNTDYSVIFVDKNRRDGIDRTVSRPFKTAAAGNNNNQNQNGGGTTQAKFSVGDKVKVNTATLNVRDTASTSGTLLGTQSNGAFGTVVSGPTVQNSYTWWKIDYESGVDGWSIENSLDKCVTSCSSQNPTNSNSTAQTSTATAPNGVVTNFEITALLDIAQNKASFDGTISYGRDLTASEWADKVGEMKVIIYKPNGDILELTDMSVNYTSARKATIKANVPNVDPANGPYKYVIWDNAFNVYSDQFVLKQNGQVSNTSGASANISFVFPTITADETSNTITINGTLTYSRDLTPAEIQYKTVGKIIATVYDSAGRVLKSGPGLFEQVSLKKFKFSVTFTGIDATAAQKVIIKDSDFNVSSDEFNLDRVGGGGGITISGAYAGAPGTKGTTTATLSDLTIDAGTASSVTVKGSVTYADTSKTGNPAVPDEKIAMKLFIVNAQNGLDFNKEIVIPNISANYNQPAAISTTVGSLDPTKKYAVQFFEQTYNNAKSSAKVIQIINGSFGQSPNQPANNNPANNQQQNQGSGGRGVLKPVVRSDLTTIPGIITALVEGVVIPIAVPLLAIAIIYTGFLFVQARGKPEKITKAKEALKWTLIGGAIILGAYIIAEALQSTISDIIRK